MRAIEQVLQSQVDELVLIKPWRILDALPLFLRSLYAVHTVTLLDNACVLVELLDQTVGIEELEEHVQRFQQATDRHAIVYFRELSHYRRMRLLERRIPFVTDDGQMFLPFLGLRLHKSSRNLGQSKGKRFSPATQLTYLWFLYHPYETINATRLAQVFGFAEMSASRALHALYQARLINYQVGGKTGRSKEYRRVDDPSFFTQAQTFLANPVKSRLWVTEEPSDAWIGGREALERFGLLPKTGRTVRVVGPDRSDLSDLHIVEDPAFTIGTHVVELEVWSYDPAMFASNGFVDSLSLVASMEGHEDEQVSRALREFLRRQSWATR